MTVLIAGGGTGGHLYPGIAVAEELRRRGHAVSFVGTERGLEMTAVPKAGFELDLVDVSGLKRVGARALAAGLLRLPRAISQARILLMRRHPSFVLGVGGYASGPMLIAAKLFGLPTAIMEQNSIPGLTNKVLGRLVDRVFVAFEGSRAFFPASKTALVGNPVRSALAGSLPASGAARPSLLVFGGSQGARRLNELVPQAIALCPERPRVLHQTGAADVDATRERYAQLGVEADVRPFIDDMASAYRGADVVVCRAGATTLAELGIVGKPAILVPLPTAADDHQTKNAAELVAAGAALLLPQPGLEPPAIAEALGALLRDPARRAQMSERMRALGRPRAASDIADAVEQLGKR